MSVRICLFSFVVCIQLTLWAATDLQAALDHIKLKSGLAVTLEEDFTVKNAILEAAPRWPLLSLPSQSLKTDQWREQLWKTDQGRAVVHPLLKLGIPVFPHAVRLLVIDMDALRKLENRTIFAERGMVSLDKHLLVYDLDIRNELQKITLPNRVPAGGIAIVDGRVVVTCNDRLRSGSALVGNVL